MHLILSFLHSSMANIYFSKTLILNGCTVAERLVLSNSVQCHMNWRHGINGPFFVWFIQYCTPLTRLHKAITKIVRTNQTIDTY